MLSALTVAVVVGLAVAAAMSGRWGTVAALVGGVGALAALSVRGYALDGQALRVQRLGWTTVVDLSGARSVELHPRLLRRSLALWHTRGLFGAVGYSYRRGLGVVRSYVTDLDRTVLVRTRSGRAIAISPKNPERFMDDVRQVTGASATPPPSPL